MAHGDLDNGGNNILVTPEGDVWLIDLGSAVMNASMETLQREERELRGLLREYQLKSPPFKYDHQEEPATLPAKQQEADHYEAAGPSSLG